MTIVAIFWLKQGHMKAFWTSLGFDSGTRINWCEERVSSLYLFDSEAKLFERDSQWLWQQNREHPLVYLQVEKWFAKYCQLSITPVEAKPTGPAKAYFEAAFINGNRLTLYAYPTGEFRFQDQIFNSETLRQSLKELLAFGPKIE